MGQKALFCEVIRSLRACPVKPVWNHLFSPDATFQLRTPLFSEPVTTSVTALCPFPSISQYQFSAFPLRLPRSFKSLLAGPRAGLRWLRAGFALVPLAARGLR